MDAMSPPASLRNRIRAVLARIGQWAAFVLVALFAILPAMNLYKINAPGAPAKLLYASIVVSVLVALAHLPHVFWRLPGRTKWLPYIAIVPSFAFYVYAANGVGEAYARTPEGAKEAAEQAEQDAERKQAEYQSQELEKDVAKAQQFSDDLDREKKKYDRCLGFFGSAKVSIEKEIKSGLRDPDSFSVEKYDFLPNSGQNVEVTFRARNGFGGMGLGRATLTLNLDTCDVSNLSVASID